MHILRLEMKMTILALNELKPLDVVVETLRTSRDYNEMVGHFPDIKIDK